MGVLGVVAGAIAGSPYLSHGADCAAGSGHLQCVMNSAAGPFLSAIAIGFVVAIGAGHAGCMLVRRLLGPAPKDVPADRAAVEVDDPVLQIAAWGMEPGGGRRVAATPVTVGDAAVPEPSARRGSATVHVLPAAARRGSHGPVGSRGKPVPTPRRSG
jgi:hypothetical protein